MAIALGLGAYELGALAVAGIGALFLATPAGQKATREAAEGIARQLERPSTQAQPVPQTKTDCPPKAKPKCPPCPPPPPPRIDRVPPSRPHWPCLGDHMHVFVMDQNPNTCQCFPRQKEVICL